MSRNKKIKGDILRKHYGNDFIRKFAIKKLFSFEDNSKKNKNLEEQIAFTKLAVDKILQNDVCEICDVMVDENSKPDILASNIPQFSDFEDGTKRLCEIIVNSGNTGLTYIEMGKYLLGLGKSDQAYQKYGENHSKLGCFLGLVNIKKISRVSKIYISPLGLVFNDLKDEKKDLLLKQLSFRIPVINKILSDSRKRETDIFSNVSSELAKSTAERRIPNIRFILNYIHENVPNEKDCFSRIEMK